MSKNGGLQGMKYQRKSFTNYPDTKNDVTIIETESKRVFREQVEAEKAKMKVERPIEIKKRSKTFIPLGDRIIVEKKKVGEKLGAGIIVATDQTSERETDLAIVKHLPELTFADKALLDNSEAIIAAQTEKAKQGDAEALKALMELNNFIKQKLVHVGDQVFISKYDGISFHDSLGNDFTVIKSEGIVAIVKDAEC